MINETLQLSAVNIYVRGRLKSVSDTLQIAESQLTTRALTRIISSTIEISEGFAKEVLGNARVKAGRKSAARIFGRSRIARIFNRRQATRGAGN